MPAGVVLGAEVCGIWVLTLRVVEARICDAWRGFGRGVERLVGLGWRWRKEGG